MSGLSWGAFMLIYYKKSEDTGEIELLKLKENTVRRKRLYNVLQKAVISLG
jgi:hypothetical protein